MTILFIDSKVLFTKGLECLLQSSGLEIDALQVASIKSGLTAIANNNLPELIFLDVNLFKDDGKYLIEDLQKISSLAPVIIISKKRCSYLERLAIKTGASGFITTACNEAVFFDAISKVLAGGIYSEFKEFTNDRLKSKPRIDVTKRQYEVLHLLSQGLLNKQIAYELKISVNTVNTHLHDIFNKLHVRNRTAAVQSAHKIGLI